MNKKIHAWIFVRSGSIKSAERNNLLLNGKPLIAYTIETAKKSRYIRDVFISTDSPEIAAVAEQYGAIVPFLRPAELADKNVPVQRAWEHAVKWNRAQNEFEHMDIMVFLPMTVPLRTADEINEAISLYLEGGCDSVIAVSQSNRHPAYDMVFVDEQNNADLILPNDDPLARTRKNNAYDITNVIHVCSADFAATEKNYLFKKTKAIIVPKEHSFDIRTDFDLKIAELIINGVSR